MEDQNFLKFFINEDIYVVPGEISEVETQTTPLIAESESKPEEIKEVEKSTIPTSSEEPVKANNQKIVEESQTTEAKETNDYTPPVYSGHFIKGVLVVVHSKGLKFDHVDLLEKIIGSIGMQKEDVAILPSGHMQSKDDFNWVNAVEKKQTFMFGLPDKWMQQFHSDITKYVNHKTEKGNLMFIDSLIELDKELSLKKQLWAQLKTINV